MKTVLHLHRKWAHTVKASRILQGLVSDCLAIRQTDRQTGRWFGGEAGKQAHRQEGGLVERQVDQCCVFLGKVREVELWLSF